MKPHRRTYNSYIKAYEDVDFLKSDAARSVRLQLELLKPEVILEQENIGDSIVCFGSARKREKKDSIQRIADIKAKLEQNPKDKKLLSHLKEALGLDLIYIYYDEARSFGLMVI